MSIVDRRFSERYERAMAEAAERFAPLTAALVRELGLDTEPVVAQTGGMVMCLAIYWPDDGAYVWISDYWWFRSELQIGLYQGDEDGLEYVMLNPPQYVIDQLVDEIEADDPAHRTQARADAIAKWARPWLAMHGAAHGWERRA